MPIEIDYKEKNYPQNHKIKLITGLILNNLNLLEAISRIHLFIDKEKSSHRNKIENKSSLNINYIVEKCMDTSVLAGDITESISKEFVKLWTSMSDEEIGKMLEEVIACLGPFSKLMNNYDLSRECKVHEANVENNFDVIFFDKKYSANYKYGQCITINNFAEFHECKKNICTYIPCDKKKDIDKIKRKLEFIKTVYEMFTCGKFYMPTLCYNSTPQQEWLNSAGYAFIRIINIQDLIKIYC